MKKLFAVLLTVSMIMSFGIFVNAENEKAVPNIIDGDIQATAEEEAAYLKDRRT